MFKKDTMLNGIIIALIVMIFGYLGLKYLNIWISEYFFDRPPIFRESTVEVIAIFLNVFPFRYFMLKANREYTGRGILLVTFVFGLYYFFHYLQ